MTEDNYKLQSSNPESEMDESAESVIVRLMARHQMTRDEALELIDEILETFAPTTASAGMDDLRGLNSKMRAAWHLLIAYQANQKTVEEMQISTRVMALELGYYTAAGADNVAELARKNNFKKQTINKCAVNFQTKLGLPPRAGQRDEEARQHMSEARSTQLKSGNRKAESGNT